MTTDQSQVEQVLTALADPTRRRLLDRLAVHGEATATVLATELPVSRQAVVKHLALLNQTGLVTGRKEGREMRYTVCSRPLDATALWLRQIAHQWDARLAAIKQLAETGSDH
jgi:DNA-binding transcriptional ArsR family regulator